MISLVLKSLIDALCSCAISRISGFQSMVPKQAKYALAQSRMSSAFQFNLSLYYLTKKRLLLTFISIDNPKEELLSFGLNTLRRLCMTLK